MQHKMEETLESSFSRVLELASDLEEEETSYSGLLKGEHVFSQFEDELHRLGIKFSVKCRSKGTKPGSTKSKRILFEYKSGHKIPFLGHPFTIEDTVYKDCHLGGRERISDLSNDKNDAKKLTKKQGCEATLIIKKLHVYIGIEVARGDDRIADYLNKEGALLKVKSGDYTTVCWYRFKISKPQFHNHDFGEEILRCQKIHPLLVEKVKELVKDGMRKAESVKYVLNHYVRNELLKYSTVVPASLNTSFYPPIKAIRNAITRAVHAEKYSKIDDEQIASITQEWKEDHVFYRPCQKMSYLPPEDRSAEVSNDDEDDLYSYYENFILVHQTLWQQEMLKKYGDVSIVDPAYNTLKYGVPLFFLIVKTNLGYIIAATFVMQFETSNSISEALRVIKNWSPEWNPRYLLSDGRDVITNAFLRTFPDSDVFVCDFYREQLWLQWLNRIGNITPGTTPEELFGTWQRLATAGTRDEFDLALTEMENSPTWAENKEAQDYLTLDWLHNQAAWVHFYRPFELQCNINMNNGAEEHKKFLKHSFLTHHISKTVSGLMKVIVNNQLVELFRNYIHGNVKLSSGYARHMDNIPDWLRGRPYSFMKHVLTRWSSASCEFHHIEEDLDSTTFRVKSSSEDYPEEAWDAAPQYSVDLTKPSCTCSDFRKWFYPCKHMCAILIFVASVSVKSLPHDYMESPYLNIDSGVVCNLPQNTTSNEDEFLNADSLTALCDQHDHTYQLSDPITPSNQSLSSLESKAIKCRAILEEMSDLTYEMSDPMKLEQVIRQLQPILREMNNQVVRDSDLMFEKAQSKKRTSPQEAQQGKKSKIMH